MNKLIKTSLIVLAVISFAACKDDGMNVKFTDIGPKMTINSCDQKAFMGDSVRFSVTLKDDFPLSTLKAKVMYDDAAVSNVTIRTKENGTYEGAVSAPLLANIPDGTASVVFTAQNTGLGKTIDSVQVAVSRPNPDYLTLNLNGTSYKMVKTADYQYSVTDVFPSDASASIVTPAIDNSGRTITLGWDGANVKAGSATLIPYESVKAGTYAISVNLLTLTADPFGKISSKVSSASNSEVLNLLQGATIVFPNITGITSWDFDYDFFAVDENSNVTFKAVDGLYKFTADFVNKFIRVEAMADADNTASLTDKGQGAVWVIGASFGKPVIGPSWDTGDGAYCMSEISDGIYQITLTEGRSITSSGYSIKFFWQKGWGGEFGASNYVANNSKDLVQITSGGNIEPAEGVSLEADKSYSFILDITKGVNAATLTVKNVVIPVHALDIKINDVQADRITSSIYRAKLDLTQNQTLTVTGISNLASYYLDPDYLKIDGGALKFNAVAGKYSVELHMDPYFVVFRKLKSDGSEGEIGDGACWLMAWGLANPSMKDYQLAWNPGSAFCMAQVSPMKFQFTGTAVGETDDTIGGRFRYDDLSFKLFWQDTWGGEMKRITFTPDAAKLLEQENAKDGANMRLKTGVTLEKGATYVLTVDMTTGTASGNSYDGTITVDLKKK